MDPSRPDPPDGSRPESPGLESPGPGSSRDASQTGGLQVGQSVGRYRILRRLGSGAMGDVFLAEDPAIERRLAIKTVRFTGVRPADLEERTARLMREAKAAGRLSHPNIVTLFDVGQDHGLHFLAFEFIAGQDLHQRLLDGPPLTVGEALSIAQQAAEGLEYAHQRGVVHRDVKPGNLLLENGGRVKISDFGIAKVLGQATELTTTGMVIGSPQYLSPEQVRGEPLDGTSDIFSLGVVLYELVTGSRPFDGETLSTLVYQILHREPPALDSLDPSLPPVLAALVRRMLDKERGHRPASAAEVAQELARILGGLPPELLARTVGSSEAAPVSTSPTHAVESGAGALGTSPPPLPPPPPPPPVAGSAAPAPGPALGSASGTASPAAFAPTASGTAVAEGSKSSGLRWALAGAVAVVILAILVLVVALGLQRWMPTDSGPQLAQQDSPLPTESPVPTESPFPETGLEAEGTTASRDLPAEDPGSATTAPSSARLPAAGRDARNETGASGEGTSTGADAGEPERSSRPTASGSSGGAESTGRESRRGSGPASSPASSLASSAPPPSPAQSSAGGDSVSTPGATGLRPRSEPGVQRPASSGSGAQSSGKVSLPVPPPPPAAQPRSELPEVPSEESPAEPAAPVDRTLDTGMELVFRVQPDDAFFLLDGRLIGRVHEYAGLGDGGGFVLPDPGSYELVLRKGGYEDTRLRVRADAARGGASPVVAKLQRRAAAEVPLGDLPLYRVSEAVAFRVRPPQAKILVDGKLVGTAVKFSGRRGRNSEWLQLERGMHRISIVAPGHRRVDIAVDFTAGATQERERITLQLPVDNDS